MQLSNSTGRTITIQSSLGPITVERGKTVRVGGILRTLEVGGDPAPDGAGLELALPAQAMVGGTDDGTEPDPADGGTDDGTPPDPADGGTDDDAPPARLDGGVDGPPSPAPAMLLSNATGQPLKVLVEKAIPADKAFRILGRLGTLEITDDGGGIAVVLRSPRPAS